MADPWTTMGVSRSASQDEVKEQWRRLCKQHHPDLQPAHMRVAAEHRFKDISRAYRVLCSRTSSLAGYADFNAAAAAAAHGHAYSAGFRTPWASGGQQPKFSNGVVGAVLFIPLLITGVWMALTFQDTATNSWRPHGLLAPPENPFLRDDFKPRVYSHMRKRAQDAARQRAAEEEAARAAAGGGTALLPAAAAAALAASAVAD